MIKSKKNRDNTLYNLELKTNEKHELIQAALDYILKFYKSLPDQKISEPEFEKVEKGVRELIEYAPPEKGRDFKVVLNELFTKYMPQAMNFPHPGYMGFIPSTGLFQAAVGDFIAKTTNRYVGHTYTSPYLTQLESNVLRWFGNFLGYPKQAKGILTSGGSIANLTAIILARTIKLKNEISKGVMYMSDQAHHSLLKGAFAAGIMKNQLKIIPSTDDLKIDLGILRTEIQNDIKNGKRPFLIIGNAGTTNAGTIDPLCELSTISQEFGCWFHVDAAYGGFFVLTKEGREKLKGIEKSDSVTMNPLKSFFLPLGLGSLIVRKGRLLDKTFSFDAHYFPDTEQTDEFWDAAHMSLELSRTFRGLSVWLPIKMHGVSEFRKALTEKLDLTKKVFNLFKEDSNWEVLYAPELSINVLSVKDPSKSTQELNKINEKIIERVKRMNRIYLTDTTIKDRFVIRVNVLNLRTHEEQINWLFEDLNKARKQVVR